MLLEMAAEGAPDRVALGSRADGLTYAGLKERVRRAAGWLEAQGAVERLERVGLVDTNSPAVPILLLAAATAGVPFAPINYREDDAKLRAVAARTAPSVLVVDPAVAERLDDTSGVRTVGRAEFLEAVAGAEPIRGAAASDPEAVAVLLFTSGTTGEPKAAVLRHRHLATYIITTVEFMGAGEDECALVSVPPYHVAGISAVLSSLYAGRRLVQLESFDPEAWVELAREENVTHAMVVPTMLGRILDVLEEEGKGLPSLRHLSYGGGRMPVPVIERALAALPEVAFVNAYGLTETSSTIAILGPEDHRAATEADDPAVRARLGSVGRPLPTVALEVRDEAGRVLGPGEHGEIFVSGEQVAGEYLGRGAALVDGWFPTRDGGHLDEGGFLFVDGRLDDVIVRGGENMSPGEIEEVLARHPAVDQVAVVGLPDPEWGERVVAAVVLAPGAVAGEAELQEWVRQRLRSSRTPERVEFRPALPYTETGKLLRRVLKSELSSPV